MVLESSIPIDDQLSNVLCYEALVVQVRKLASSGHVNLVETGRASRQLLPDQLNVQSVKVQIEKLDVFSDASSVGIEIDRSK